MTISNKDLEHFYGQARSKLAGASDAQIKVQFYDCMQEFLDKSQSWKELITINVISGTQDYIVTPSSGQIIRLEAVYDSFMSPQPAFLSEFSDGLQAKIHFQFAYNQAQTFTAVVVKNISLPTSKHGVPDMPSWILPKFGYRIIDGVVGQLMNEDRRPYSNPAKAQYYLRRFLEGVGMARAAAVRAYTIGAQRWTFPQGYQTRTQRGGISVANPNQFD